MKIRKYLLKRQVDRVRKGSDLIHRGFSGHTGYRQLAAKDLIFSWNY